MAFNWPYLKNQILNKCVILEKKQGRGGVSMLTNHTAYQNTHDDGRFLFRLNNSGDSMELMWCVMGYH